MPNKSTSALILIFVYDYNPASIRLGDISPTTYIKTISHRSTMPLLDEIEQKYEPVKSKFIFSVLYLMN